MATWQGVILKYDILAKSISTFQEDTAGLSFDYICLERDPRIDDLLFVINDEDFWIYNFTTDIWTQANGLNYNRLYPGTFHRFVYNHSILFNLLTLALFFLIV